MWNILKIVAAGVLKAVVKDVDAMLCLWKWLVGKVDDFWSWIKEKAAGLFLRIWPGA